MIYYALGITLLNPLAVSTIAHCLAGQSLNLWISRFFIQLIYMHFALFSSCKLIKFCFIIVNNERCSY